MTSAGLSRNEKAAIVAVAVAQFLFLHGVLWQHLYDVDASILWSYATLPVLVTVVLVLRRRFAALSFFLGTIEVVAWKFVVTASILLVILALRGGPPQAPSGRIDAPLPVSSVATTAPPLRPVEPARTGRVHGRVLDANGLPVAGALVWISAGVDGYAFTPAAASVRLENDGHAIRPALAVVEVGQPLELLAGDRRLHTFAGTVGADMVWNFPALASGALTQVRIAEASGLTTVSCTVAPETPARLLVVAHPFHAFTGPDGGFTWSGVPAGDLELRATRPGVARARATLAAGGDAAVELTVR